MTRNEKRWLCIPPLCIVGLCWVMAVLSMPEMPCRFLASVLGGWWIGSYAATVFNHFNPPPPAQETDDVNSKTKA